MQLITIAEYGCQLSKCIEALAYDFTSRAFSVVDSQIV